MFTSRHSLICLKSIIFSAGEVAWFLQEKQLNNFEISVYAVLMLKIQVGWVVTLTCKVIDYRRFEETYRLHLQDLRSSKIMLLLDSWTLEFKAIRSLELSKIITLLLSLNTGLQEFSNTDIIRCNPSRS